jgi:hypothetical protein
MVTVRVMRLHSRLASQDSRGGPIRKANQDSEAARTRRSAKADLSLSTTDTRIFNELIPQFNVTEDNQSVRFALDF